MANANVEKKMKKKANKYPYRTVLTKEFDGHVDTWTDRDSWELLLSLEREGRASHGSYRRMRAHQDFVAERCRRK